MKNLKEPNITLSKIIECKINEYKESLKKFQNENGDFFIMEESDAVFISCYQKFIEDLSNLKKLIQN